MSDVPNPTMSLAEASAGDDMVLPFQAVRSGISGRLIRLGSVVDELLSTRDYPAPVAKALGDAITITALLGVALKFDSKFILQTKTDGPLGFLVVNFSGPGSMRAYASFDREKVEALEAEGEVDEGVLLGHGHLAMTIDPGEGMDRYQGIVALEGESLVEAADVYFQQSEQLPTMIKVATARHYVKPEDDADIGDDGWQWRSGGLIVQRLGVAGEAVEEDDESPLKQSAVVDEERDEDWQRTRILAESVEDHEMLDPLLEPERLLYRLFHEEGVRVFEKKPLDVHCACSRDKVLELLTQFSDADVANMVTGDGTITVTCEYCNLDYSFNPDEVPAPKDDDASE